MRWSSDCWQERSWASSCLMSSLLPTESSDLAVAGSTLVVAALFNPLRRRVQGGVDRRFNRQRYDAQRVMDGFASSLRDRADPEEVMHRLGWCRLRRCSLTPSGCGCGTTMGRMPTSP